MASTYSSPRRAESAAATRAAILDNARRMFLDRGYAYVTVTDIAKAARVAVPTVYTSAGGKAAILAELLRPALDDSSAAESLAVVAAAGSGRAVIAATAAGTRRNHERHWDSIYGLLRHATVDTEARRVIDTGTERYLRALGTVADRLLDLAAAKPGIDREQAVDLLWFHLGQPAWFTLVGDRGWSFDRAESWLGGAARQALLRGPDA